MEGNQQRLRVGLTEEKQKSQSPGLFYRFTYLPTLWLLGVLASFTLARNPKNYDITVVRWKLLNAQRGYR